MWCTTPHHDTVSVLPTHANHTIIGIFPKAGVMRLHENNTSLKSNTILSHTLRKNLEVISSFILKSQQVEWKKKLKFIIDKISYFVSKWRLSKDQVGNTARIP